MQNQFFSGSEVKTGLFCNFESYKKLSLSNLLNSNEIQTYAHATNENFVFNLDTQETTINSKT